MTLESYPRKRVCDVDGHLAGGGRRAPFLLEIPLFLTKFLMSSIHIKMGQDVSSLISKKHMTVLDRIPITTFF